MTGEGPAPDGDQPVLIGVGTAIHRPDDGPTPDPFDLMVDAVLAAGDDAGAGRLEAVGWLGVPRGTWAHQDPGHLIATRAGLGDPHTVVAEVGVLQQTLLTGAIEAVRRGTPTALVVGGEAAHRGSAGAAAAVAGTLTAEDRRPDEHWTTDDYGISDQELGRGFVDPPTVYAVIESALAHEAGRSPTEQRTHLGRLQARFSEVVTTNPDAWITEPVGATAVSTPSADNRLVADPYTKLCCSNLRVNQAAALLVTTVDRARAAGVPRERWVFPLSATESNLSVPVLHRPELHRSRGAALAGHRALELAGVEIADLDHLDLYSCFPAAVQVFAAELGVDLERGPAPTVTGGMTFAGGPLNNYVLQSTAAMARALRADPGGTGLVTAVSGMLHKQGFAAWSTEPPAAGFRCEDVTARVGELEPRRAETGDHVGPVTVVGQTVVHERDGSARALAVAETTEGLRVLAGTADPDLVDRFTHDDLVGQTLRADGAELRA